MTSPATVLSSVRARGVFVGAAVVCVASRAALSQLGYNFDLESWDIAGSLVLDGEAIYAHTSRYPYAPPGAYLLATLRGLSDALGLHRVWGFHLLLALLLAAVDVGIARMLWSSLGLGSACFYLLSPVGLLLNGYHTQLDGFALFFALWAWRAYRKAQQGGDVRTAWKAALLFGVSLSFKHVLFMFPLWLAAEALRRGDGWRRAAFHPLVAYGVFASTFGLYLLVFPESAPGILHHVFLYRGDVNYGLGLLPALLRILSRLLGGPGNWSDVFGHFSAVFLFALAALGAWTAKHRPESSLFLYLVGLTLFTSTMADQYFLIPLVACAGRPRTIGAWSYTVAATAALLLSPFNVGPRLGLPLFVLHPLAQLPLVLLLWDWMRRPSPSGAPEGARPGAPA